MKRQLEMLAGVANEGTHDVSLYLEGSGDSVSVPVCVSNFTSIPASICLSAEGEMIDE